MRAVTPVRVTSKPMGSAPASAAIHAANDSQMILSSPNQPLTVARAERSATPQQEYRLQQRGLAGAVVAPDQREPAGDLKLCRLDGTHVGDAELDETHATSPKSSTSPGGQRLAVGGIGVTGTAFAPPRTNVPRGTFATDAWRSALRPGARVRCTDCAGAPDRRTPVAEPAGRHTTDPGLPHRGARAPLPSRQGEPMFHVEPAPQRTRRRPVRAAPGRVAAAPRSRHGRSRQTLPMPDERVPTDPGQVRPGGRQWRSRCRSAVMPPVAIAATHPRIRGEPSRFADCALGHWGRPTDARLGSGCGRSRAGLGSGE